MKETKKMWIYLIDIVIGAMLAFVGWVNIKNEYYSSLLFATGFALAFSAAVQIIRLIYWNSPKHVEEYEAKKQEAHIDAVDERKRHIREKAGYITYQFMAIALMIIMIILALLHVEAWIIGMLFLLFCLQCSVWIIVFRRLEKRM